MASAALTAMLLELRQRHEEVAPELEGFRDFARLDLQPPTMAFVQEMITIYEQRLVRIDEALRVLEALEAHGYPEIPTRPVPPAIYDDLVAQIMAQEAAFDTVILAKEAVAGHITPVRLEDVEV